jgi:hypothetical protein
MGTLDFKGPRRSLVEPVSIDLQHTCFHRKALKILVPSRQNPGTTVKQHACHFTRASFALTPVGT